MAQSNNADLDIDLCESVTVSAPTEGIQVDYIGMLGATFKFHPDYMADNSKLYPAQWTSKDLDFTDQFEQYRNYYFTIDSVVLEYVDLDADTPATVHLSNDGGINWVTKTLTLGDGDETQKVAIFWFLGTSRCTGKKFVLRLSSSSTTKRFIWTGIGIRFFPRGKYMEVA